MQNIPNPDVNSPDTGSTNRNNTDVEPSRSDKSDEAIPVPPDEQPTVPIEDPPDVQDKPPIGEDENEPEQIV
ncbi:MAG TPA: hypothetical protein VF721_01695 [Pyrinomonadaceae bacterium]|jgi:hypothetical protein